MPLGKQQCEIITCEQIGTDIKGNKISSGLDSNDKQGLKVCDKQRVSAWDLLEGHKNPAPLSWSWFSAVRVERKPLWYEENHRMLKFHTHSLVKSASYFLEPLPLPPEDLEPPQEKPVSIRFLIYSYLLLIKYSLLMFLSKFFYTYECVNILVISF